MAIRVKNVTELAKKFVTRAGSAGADYKSGVEAGAADWEANTAASEDTWAAGVQEAIGAKRFGSGVRKAGSKKYVERASVLGAQRYPQGIAAAEKTWADAVSPFLEVIKGLTLPPRRPKGSPENYQRVQVVGEALRAARVGR